MLSFLYFLIYPFLILLHGYALCYLWQWFLVPYFHIQKISIALAIGFLLITEYMTKSFKYEDYDLLSEDQKNKKMICEIIFSITKPMVAIIFGYAIQKFI